jgi:hypothetical protein
MHPECVKFEGVDRRESDHSRRSLGLFIRCVFGVLRELSQEGDAPNSCASDLRQRAVIVPQTAAAQGDVERAKSLLWLLI